MWLNTRELTADNDGITTHDGVWGFASSSQSASHGSIGVSGSRALWNRMELAEEEREEEALPSYLSYVQPAFHSASTTSTTFVSSVAPSGDFYTPKRSISDLSTPSYQLSQRVLATPEVNQVTCKSSELAQALEHLVLDSVQRHVNETTMGNAPIKCTCSCSAMQIKMQEMERKVQTLQNQVLELTKNTIPTASEVGRASNNNSWSATAPPFVPKQQQYKQPSLSTLPLHASTMDQSTATVLSDRISTLEGRQSAFQSQLAQIAKVLGIPAGKPGKHIPVKHLVQTLRDEVDAKMQEARIDLIADMRTALGDFAVGDKGKDGVSLNAILAALAGEHEASLASLSESFEGLLAEEARQRAALEARVRSQLAQQEEWLQQLEGAFGSPHDPEHDQDPGRKDWNIVQTKLAALEQRCEESHKLCKCLARLLPDATNFRLLLKPGEEEEEEEKGLSWPGHVVDIA
ncbi:unnamed protein product [Peronospora belbahrii]|uniref:Uncharacterized protein n=1 Tax=Peronospora belbahrii TaxID=622444 RepID=A0AAU9L0X3_9STRA|nr:unnamed protein product [Peronospora belbahrii]